MTKIVGNQENLNFSFKIKLIKKELPKTPKVLGTSIYQQMKNNGTTIKYNSGQFSTDNLKEVLEELFTRNTQANNRQIKVITNQAGMNAFEKALKEEVTNLINKKDEHRKKLDFRSEVFKQTYKFR